MSWQQLMVLALQYRRALLLGSLILLLQNLVLLTLPWVLGNFAASFFATNVALLISVPLILALFLIEAGLKIVSTMVLAKLMARVATDLRQKVQQKVMQLPMTSFDNGKRGDLISLMSWETDQLCSFVGGTLVGIVPQLIMVAGAMVIMFLVEPRLALLVGAGVPFFYLMMKIIARKLRPLAVQLREAQSDAFVLLEEQLELITLIKMFGREKIETTRYQQQLAKVTALQLEQARINAFLEPVLQLLIATAVVIVLASNAPELDNKGPGQLFSFILYAILLTRPVSALAAVYGQVQAARGNLARLSAVMDTPLEHEQGMVLDTIRGEIEFKDLGFTYPGRPPLLQQLGLKVQPGETVAITGHNGNGKSTLVKLLLRLYLPDKGLIMLDGHNIQSLDVSFLRSQITVVSQQQLLQNATIAANIAYGVPDATREAIEDAARKAQAEDFIQALPEKYETCIGDQGIRISGGQAQRIALARAFLRRAPVLVLDEATAMFDPDGEAALLYQFRQFMKGVTVILITHRPPSLALADRVLCLEQGRLREVTRTLESNAMLTMS